MKLAAGMYKADVALRARWRKLKVKPLTHSPFSIQWRTQRGLQAAKFGIVENGNVKQRRGRSPAE